MLSLPSMKNVPLLIATLLGTFVIIVGVAVMFSKNSAPEVTDAASVVEGARHFISGTESASPSATPVDSTDSAEPEQKKVQVVEFSDFQCPACKAAAPLAKQILNEYPTQVEFVYRHFPLTQIHANAMLAAQASEAAATFDKFWEMHDKLFETQTEWENLSNGDARAKFISYAEELGLNKEEFTSKLDDDTLKQNVQTDINRGNSLKVSATPTFYVNGIKVTAPEILSTVEQELNK